ncbi:MAG: DUF2330 domain-containing protein [Cyanobacteria bacterium P01_H01_bin.15]
MRISRILLSCVIAIASFVVVDVQPAQAFCGFYVAKADTSLYSQASQVVIARNGQRTILTMANDYQGAPKDFALVVPVPVILKANQVNVGDSSIIDRLDGFSAPRLVEYEDGNPCRQMRRRNEVFPTALSADSVAVPAEAQAEKLGVTVEETFSVGEYDIVILSAQESDGLETWLRQNNYQIPSGASKLLKPYIRQGLKFFVAKVNLGAYADTGFQSLRPLQIAFESPRFMLPIRLGTLNAQGEQDLLVYILSPQGQATLTNYRTVKIPSNVNIPEFVEGEFKVFYTSLFETAYAKEDREAAFLEYAWDMSNCDPCSAEPLSPDELRQAGVFWIDRPQGLGNRVFISRIHVRYTRDRFPEDLQFQETGNQELFQGRYVIRHPYRGSADCPQARRYQQQVRERQEQEAQTLAQLTGWDLDSIRRKINFLAPAAASSVDWWRPVWRQQHSVPTHSPQRQPLNWWQRLWSQ